MSETVGLNVKFGTQVHQRRYWRKKMQN